MNPEELRELPELEPVGFELAAGHLVQVKIGLFWERLTESDRRFGQQPRQYYAIRIYSNEDTWPRRMELRHEFRDGCDFANGVAENIRQWLVHVVSSRAYLEYDSMEEFLNDFAENIDRICSAPEDVVEHIEHLPALNHPEAFDHVDDSVYNDQNELPELPVSRDNNPQ